MATLKTMQQAGGDESSKLQRTLKGNDESIASHTLDMLPLWREVSTGQCGPNVQVSLAVWRQLLTC